MSWSVRGVENDAREWALEAAREAGVPVGEWLSGLILQGANARAPHHPHAMDTARSREPLRERVERLSSTATATTPRPRAAGAPTVSDGDVKQVAEIARALDDLLGEARAPGPRLDPQRARSAEKPALHSQAASRPRADNDPARVKRVERVLATLDNLDRRVRTLAGNRVGGENETSHPVDSIKATMPASSEHSRSLQSAIDEISARKNDLHTIRESAPAHHGRLESPPPAAKGAARDTHRATPSDNSGFADIDQHFGDLAGNIDSLREPRDALLDDLRSEMTDLRTSIVNHERDGASKRDLSDMNRLADLVDRLHGETADSGAVEGLRADIAKLRDAVIDNNIDGTLKTLELGYAHIVQRLDELRRTVGDPRVLENLDDRLIEIENTLAKLPKLHEFSNLEDRLRNLSEQIEHAANRDSGADIVHLENEMQALRRMISELDVRDIVRSVDDRLRGVGERIGELEQMLGQAGGVGERIAAMEQRLPETDAFDRLNHRLERICTMLSEDRAATKPDMLDARLSEIVGRLDSIERRPVDETKYDTVLHLLENRIDALSAKLDEFNANPTGSDALDAAVRRIDDALGRVSDTHRIEDLQSQIAKLMESLEDGGLSGGQTDDISSLRREVSELRRDLTQPQWLVDILEPQIQELARTLSSGDRLTPDDASLARIEQQIAVIAGQLDATEDRLSGLSDIEAALGQIGGALAGERQPARASSQNDDVDALRGDLSRLMEVAGAGALDADAGVEEIQAALNAIVNRLSSLENEAVQMRGHAGYATGGQVAMTAPAVAMGGGGRGRATAPMASALDKALSGGRPTMPTDIPLEPGSGKPDLAALLREHGERGEQRTVRAGSDEGTRDRKADFIAAARRAAQAAASEVAAEEIGSQADASEGAASRGGWFSNRMKGSSVKPSQHANAEPIGTDVDPDAADHGEQANERPLGRIRRALRSRRPIVLAAAAVILAIGALTMTPADQIERAASLVVKPAQLFTTGAVPYHAASPTVTSVVADAPRAPVTTTFAPPPASPAKSNAAASLPDDSVTFEPPAAALAQFTETSPDVAANSFTPAPVWAGSDVVASLAPDAATRPAADAIPPIDATPPNSGGEQDFGLTAPMPEEAVGPLSLRLASANGNPRAQFEVAARYTEGRGVLSDPVKAAKWYGRAAEGGLAPAQYRLGSLYEKGRGVSNDPGAARMWYLRAADQGNAKAMHNLAVLYAAGGVGTPDFAKATEWFKRASRLGVRDSQFNLGILYARGFGVNQDLIESYRWFALAALQGDNDAAAKRDEIAKNLAPEDLVAANLLISAWQPEPQREETNTVTLDPMWTDEPARQSAAASEELVLQAQLLLGELGFDTGPADGVTGPKTRDAVRTFQANNGMPATGTIDRKLIQVLSGRAI